nr:unnamed protein product [Callosobruchus analis]
MADSFLSNTVVTDEVDGNKEKTRNEARLRIKDAQEKQKQRFDAKRKTSYQYKVGDHVVLRRTNFSNDGKSQKLVPKY